MLLFLKLIFLTSFLFAQKQSTFVGIVQYTKGDVSIVNSQGTHQAQYKTTLRAGDRIASQGGLIKIISDNYCIFVLYKGELLTASEAFGKWSIPETSSLRVICPSNRSQLIQIGTQEVLLSDGELFFHDKKLVVSRGKAQSGLRKLKNELTLTIKEDRWRVHQPKPTSRELYSYLNTFELPKESVVQAIEKPDLEPKFRFYLAGFPTGIGSVYHSEAKYRYHSNRSSSVRLMSEIKMGEGALMLGVSYIDGQNSWNEDGNHGPYNGPGPDPNTHLKFDMFSAQVGWRFDFLNWYGFYTKFGINRQNYRINSPSPDGNDYINSEVVYIGADLSLGFEAIIFKNSWIALITGIEGVVSHTLSRQRILTNVDRPTPVFREDEPLSTLHGLIFVGPVLQF